MVVENNVEVKILIDGAPAAELGEPLPNEAAGNITTRYIEAKSGSQFGFGFKALPSYRFGGEDGLKFSAYIDGKPVAALTCLRKRFYPSRGWESHLQSRRVGRGHNQRELIFRFADLETEDVIFAEELEAFGGKNSQLGCLEVKVFRVRSLGCRDRQIREEQKRNFNIPETAYKGRAIALTGRVEERHVYRPSAGSVLQTMNLGRAPHAHFMFHYRTRAGLESEMIVPRSQSPATIDKTAVEDLAAVRREMTGKQRALDMEAVTAKIKREHSSSALPPIRPSKTFKMADGAILYHLECNDEQGQEVKEVFTYKSKVSQYH